jgi:histidinol-phosphate/aromatic aminotransferase/cobyric acid decarboxylase-like protein
LARIHGLPEQWLVFGAGLETVIDQIARAVLDPGDRVLIAIPNFDVFESVSLRMGANLVHMPLRAPDFCFDHAAIDCLIRQMRQQSVKLLWISNPVLCRAVNAYRPMFPFSLFSLYMAQLAVIDTEHLEMIRIRLEENKSAFFRTVEKESESRLNDYEFLGTDTNTVMFRHVRLSAGDLHAGLSVRGFLTANLNRLAGIRDQQFLRMTLHPCEINDLFMEACANIG